MARNTVVRTWSAMIAVVLVASVTTGCGAREDVSANESPTSTVTTTTVPGPTATAADGTVFTGPYANQFRGEWEHAKSDLGRGILRDGQITDAEMAEAQDAFRSCIAGYGGTVTFNSRTGDIMEIVSDADDERWNASGDDDPAVICGNQTDFTAIAFIHTKLVEHPDGYNPEAELQSVVDCLVSHGFADSSLTVEEYSQIVEDHQRELEVFNKYENPSNPDYNVTEAQRFLECQGS